MSDLGAEIASDPAAPQTNTRLIAYLRRRGVDEDVLQEAVQRWKNPKSRTRVEREALPV